MTSPSRPSNFPNIDGFEDLEPIGRGASGQVYRARQPRLNRDVAIKVLSAQLDDDELTRFERESRALGELSGHPNIVTVYDSGRTADTGAPYLVMDLMGQSVEAILPLGESEALDIVQGCAKGLAASHQIGVLHRDVKPANMFVDRYGEGRLGDFGLVGLSDPSKITTASIGSPAYMAPELFDEQGATIASDIYALAASAYEMIEGVVPFVTTSGVPGLIRQILNEPPRPPERMSPAVAATILRALSKNPADRQAAVEEFANQLRRPLPPVTVPPTPSLVAAPTLVASPPPHLAAPITPTREPSAPNSRRWALVGAAAAVIALIVGIVALRGGGNSDRRVATVDTTEPTITSNAEVPATPGSATDTGGSNSATPSTTVAAGPTTMPTTAAGGAPPSTSVTPVSPVSFTTTSDDDELISIDLPDGADVVTQLNSFGWPSIESVSDDHFISFGLLPVDELTLSETAEITAPCTTTGEPSDYTTGDFTGVRVNFRCDDFDIDDTGEYYVFSAPASPRSYLIVQTYDASTRSSIRATVPASITVISDILWTAIDDTETLSADVPADWIIQTAAADTGDALIHATGAGEGDVVVAQVPLESGPIDQLVFEQMSTEGCSFPSETDTLTNYDDGLFAGLEAQVVCADGWTGSILVAESNEPRVRVLVLAVFAPDFSRAAQTIEALHTSFNLV